jgi:hypothetical protein
MFGSDPDFTPLSNGSDRLRKQPQLMMLRTSAGMLRPQVRSRFSDANALRGGADCSELFEFSADSRRFAVPVTASAKSG